MGIVTSPVDGIGFTDGTEADAGTVGTWSPGFMPGKKLRYLGQFTTISRAVTQTGTATEQPAPVAGLTYTHPAAGTTLKAGRYWLYYAFNKSGTPSQESHPSPITSVDILDGEKIAYTIPDALPAWATRFNIYMWAAPLGPPRMTRGLITTQTTAGPFDYTGTVLAPNIWGPQTGMGMGSVMLPALAGAATATVTVKETLINSNSYIFGTIHQSATAPAAGVAAFMIWHIESITAGVGFVLKIRNASAATATIITDYAFDYMIVN